MEHSSIVLFPSIGPLVVIYAVNKKESVYVKKKERKKERKRKKQNEKAISSVGAYHLGSGNGSGASRSSGGRFGHLSREHC